MFVNFIHPVTGEMRQVKLGVSWTLFLFWWFYGVPFFIRKMISYGIGVIILPFITGLIYSIIMGLFFNVSEMQDIVTFFVLLIIQNLIISILLLIYGNKMTAKYYVKKGFRIYEQDDYKKRTIQTMWLFPDEAFVKQENKVENQ